MLYYFIAKLFWIKKVGAEYTRAHTVLQGQQRNEGSAFHPGYGLIAIVLQSKRSRFHQITHRWLLSSQSNSPQPFWETSATLAEHNQLHEGSRKTDEEEPGEKSDPEAASKPLRAQSKTTSFWLFPSTLKTESAFYGRDSRP